MSTVILTGDCMAKLREIPDASIQCCVTSPPYYGLRDYGAVGQIGLEPSPEEYVATMVEAFEGVRRVLKPDGVMFLNIGDSYATGAGKVGAHPGGGAQGEKWKGGPPSDKSTLRGNGHVGGGPKIKTLPGVGGRGTHTVENSGKAGPRIAAMGPMTQPSRMPLAGLKPKDLIGVPWRLAFALQAAGWWLRSEIIWAKPNGMPGSQEDRVTSSHEAIFMLSKSGHYYSDFDAIKTPPREATTVRLSQEVQAQAGSHRGNGGGKTNGPMKAVPGKQRGHSRRHAGFNDRWDTMDKAEQQSRPVMMRDVWFVSPGGYEDAHFAVMPEEIARRCILAGSRPGDTILDPFGGAGTVGMVAERLQRSAILIELNPSYAEMARRRIEDDAPLLAEVANG